MASKMLKILHTNRRPPSVPRNQAVKYYPRLSARCGAHGSASCLRTSIFSSRVVLIAGGAFSAVRADFCATAAYRLGSLMQPFPAEAPRIPNPVCNGPRILIRGVSNPARAVDPLVMRHLSEFFRWWGSLLWCGLGRFGESVWCEISGPVDLRCLCVHWEQGLCGWLSRQSRRLYALAQRNHRHRKSSRSQMASARGEIAYWALYLCIWLLGLLLNWRTSLGLLRRRMPFGLLLWEISLVI